MMMKSIHTVLFSTALTAVGLASTIIAQRPVTVVAAVAGPIQTEIVLQAEVRADAFAIIVPRVTGTVATVHVNEGDVVEQGALLCELACPDLDAELAAAAASVVVAGAAVESARASIGPLRAAVEVAKARVSEAESSITAAAAELNVRQVAAGRTRRLFEDGAATQEVLEQVDARVIGATASLDAAKTGRLSAEAEVRRCEAELVRHEATIRKVVAEHDRARAGHDHAAVLVGFARIVSPYPEARVVRRVVDPGALVEADVTEMFEILDPARVRVRAMVPESDASAVRAGSKARILRNGAPAVDADITRVSGAIDSMSRTMAAEIVLDNDGSWLHGSLCRVKIVTRAIDEAVTIPTRAWIKRGGESFALVVGAGDLVKRTPIVVGVDLGDRVQVVSGLEAGALVITSGGAAGLVDGASVAPKRMDG